MSGKVGIGGGKNLAYEVFYKLDTKREWCIYKLAKIRSRRRRDFEAVKYIKDVDKRVFEG